MIYKIIENFPRYEISIEGVVRNIKTRRILHPYVQKGYYRIDLVLETKKSKSVAIHRLLALTFIPNPDNKPIIDHINRDKSDNRICNLRWSTYKENANNVDPENRRHKKDRIRCDFGVFYSSEIDKWIFKRGVNRLNFDSLDGAIDELKRHSKMILDNHGV